MAQAGSSPLVERAVLLPACKTPAAPVRCRGSARLWCPQGQPCWPSWQQGRRSKTPLWYVVFCEFCCWHPLCVLGNGGNREAWLCYHPSLPELMGHPCRLTLEAGPGAPAPWELWGLVNLHAVGGWCRWFWLSAGVPAHEARPRTGGCCHCVPRQSSPVWEAAAITVFQSLGLPVGHPFRTTACSGQPPIMGSLKPCGAASSHAVWWPAWTPELEPPGRCFILSSTLIPLPAQRGLYSHCRPFQEGVKEGHALLSALSAKSKVFSISLHPF